MGGGLKINLHLPVTKNVSQLEPQPICVLFDSPVGLLSFWLCHVFLAMNQKMHLITLDRPGYLSELPSHAQV
jgi:hypothetical protein